MHREPRILRSAASTILLGAALLHAGCGRESTPASDPAATAAPAPAPEPAEPAMLEPTAQTWTPEELEELFAPVALYPDIVLGQMLVAASNPQEVLDAGNWLLQNTSLEGDALDEAAKGVGFTPPVRALMQSRDVVDMMCSEMGWTTELGQAYVNDQAGALEAVQRLRAQAKDAGNLASSEQMKVDTVVQEGQEVITLSPPSTEVVYVPQYDPVAVYAPPATTVATSTTTVQQGHSTGALVATGLLSFGAGLLVGEIFDDDDDDDWHHPHYYGRAMPYYPRYPYRPRYGSGFHPNNDYRRPPGYQHGFNNNTIIVNQNGGYWKRYDDHKIDRRTRSAASPISAARPNRPELGSLNAKAKQGPKRSAPGVDDSWKGKSSYADAKPGAGRPDRGKGGSVELPQTAKASAPKVQGSYAGAKRTPGPAAAKPSGPSAAREAAKPARSKSSNATADRGRASNDRAKPASQPPNRAATASRADHSAVSGADHGKADHAAGQRGKQSLSHGGKDKGGKGKGGKDKGSKDKGGKDKGGGKKGKH